MPLHAGDRLGPYEILGVVGAGGMGEVHRARDPRLGRDVALKVLPSDRASDPERLRRFEHEARAVAALNHPNILSIHDTGAESDLSYVVFELLEGQTVRDLLQKGPLSPAKVADYGVQICRGLAAAHEKGIVHRDLKPENLFLTRDGIVKILDFGLARLAHPLHDEGEEATTLSQGTDPGVVMGTVGYMSPEQVRGEPADHRSDLFSLGAVLYEMLSGQRAFRGTSSVETLNAILKEEPHGLPPDRPIPPALERLVRHCLEKNPEDRFQSARDLAFELGGVSATSGISGRASVRGRTRRGRRWLAGGLIALAVGSALGVGLFVGRRSSTPAPPTYKQITFRRGLASSGRFTPDGKTVVYAASWDDAPAPEIYSVRTDAPESKSLGLPSGQVVGVSSKGELAMLLPQDNNVNANVLYPAWAGTLARVPLSGGTPRPVAENVVCADWAPDGERLAALRYANGVRQVEFPLGTVLARETPAERPLSCPRISPRGDRLAFGTPQGYRVFETASGRSFAIKGVPEWGHHTWWAWSPSGEEIWFTASDDPYDRPLEAVSLSGRRRMLATIAGAMGLYDVSRDGLVLLEHAFSRTRAVAQAPGQTAERELSVFDGTQVRDLSADGTFALLYERGAAAGLRQFIYLRRTDGAAPMRLAEEGAPLSLSPDGRWVLVGPSAFTFEAPRWSGLRLVPVGAGDARAIPTPGLDVGGIAHGDQLTRVAWILDERRILALAQETSGRTYRFYLLDVNGGGRRAVTPDLHFACGVGQRSIACLTPKNRITLYPLEGGEPREVPGLTVAPGLNPLRLSEDETSLFVNTPRYTRTAPIRVERIDLASGRRSPVRELKPADMAGVWLCFDPLLTPDGRGYAYAYIQILHNLYLADGVR